MSKGEQTFRLRWLGIVGQLLGFAAVGLVGTAAHFLVLMVGVEVFGMAAEVATVPGFVAGALVNYGLNRTFVFHSKVHHRRGLPRFFIIAFIGLLLNTGIMILLLKMTSLHYLLAQAITAGIVLLWNFTGNRLWTFARLESLDE